MLVLVTPRPITDPPPPIDNAVVLFELAEHLRVGTDEDHQDDVLRSLLAAAIAYLHGPDGVLGRALFRQTWDLVLDHFPCAGTPIELGISPVLEDPAPSCAYLDVDGDEQAWTSFLLDPIRGRLLPTWGTRYPATRALPNAVSVRFTAGPSRLAEADRALLFSLVAHWFENREPVLVGATAQSLPFHLAAMIDAQRRIVL
jgi:uncharacterized phiE125 gp8 family phage protein